jgi:hypothetical protein
MRCRRRSRHCAGKGANAQTYSTTGSSQCSGVSPAKWLSKLTSTSFPSILSTTRSLSPAEHRFSAAGAAANVTVATALSPSIGLGASDIFGIASSLAFSLCEANHSSSAVRSAEGAVARGSSEIRKAPNARGGLSEADGVAEAEVEVEFAGGGAAASVLPLGGTRVSPGILQCRLNVSLVTKSLAKQFANRAPQVRKSHLKYANASGGLLLLVRNVLVLDIEAPRQGWLLPAAVSRWLTDGSERGVNFPAEPLPGFCLVERQR